MDFAMFDADQHYYEAEDCLTRFASKRMQTEKFVRWVAEMDGKRKRLFIGGRDANVIPNPTFNPIAQPGVYHETLKKLEAGNDRTAIAYGELEPIRPAGFVRAMWHSARAAASCRGCLVNQGRSRPVRSAVSTRHQRSSASW